MMFWKRDDAKVATKDEHAKRASLLDPATGEELEPKTTPATIPAFTPSTSKITGTRRLVKWF